MTLSELHDYTLSACDLKEPVIYVFADEDDMHRFVDSDQDNDNDAIVAFSSCFAMKRIFNDELANAEINTIVAADKNVVAVVIDWDSEAK